VLFRGRFMKWYFVQFHFSIRLDLLCRAGRLGSGVILFRKFRGIAIAPVPPLQDAPKVCRPNIKATLNVIPTIITLARVQSTEQEFQHTCISADRRRLSSARLREIDLLNRFMRETSSSIGVINAHRFEKRKSITRYADRYGRRYGQRRFAIHEE
jgi:hypothetical protein